MVNPSTIFYMIYHKWMLFFEESIHMAGFYGIALQTLPRSIHFHPLVNHHCFPLKKYEQQLFKGRIPSWMSRHRTNSRASGIRCAAVHPLGQTFVTTSARRLPFHDIWKHEVWGGFFKWGIPKLSEWFICSEKSYQSGRYWEYLHELETSIWYHMMKYQIQPQPHHALKNHRSWIV